MELARFRDTRRLEADQPNGLWFDEAEADRVVDFFSRLRHLKGE